MGPKCRNVASGVWRVASGGHLPLAPCHLPLCLSLLLLPLGTGCRVVQTAVEAPGQTVRAVTPGKKGKNAIDRLGLQQTLLRFADDFFMHTILGVDQLRRGTNALDRAEGFQWKITLGTETCSIASGPNAVADVLDMAVSVAVMRAALEDYWRPKVSGESAQPMLNSCRSAGHQRRAVPHPGLRADSGASGSDGATVDRVGKDARPDARLDQPRQTRDPSRPGGSAGAGRQRGDRGLRFLEKHPVGSHRARGRLDSPRGCRAPGAYNKLEKRIAYQSRGSRVEGRGSRAGSICPSRRRQ